VCLELAVVGGPLSESQSTQFQDFLLRANKYPTLQIFHQEQLHRKVILVEVIHLSPSVSQQFVEYSHRMYTDMN